MANYFLCLVAYFSRSDNLLDFFETLVIRIYEQNDRYVKFAINKIGSNKKYYAISDYLILNECRVEALYILYYPNKDSGDLFFCI